MVHAGVSKSKTALLILSTISALLLALTLFVGGREAAFVLRASRATASFQGAFAHSGGNHGGTFLYPQFRFLTGDGQSIEVTSNIGSTDQPYSYGQKEVVLYDPQIPRQAVLDHFWILWGGTAVAGLITLVMLSITFLIERLGSRASMQIDRY